jgi:hypothetical protein
MDLSQSLNINTAPEHPLFSPTYLNLEYVFNEIYKFFHSIGQAFSGTSVSGPNFGVIYHTVLTVLALFFIVMIAYCSVRMFEIRAKEREHLEHEITEYAERQAKKAKFTGASPIVNERWDNVLKYLSSENPSDWKVAVIEADAMLEDLTDTLEFEGENLGERLKSANREKFKTLDEAWEAHLIRNRIAHEGLKFDLTLREAQRAVALYERVFQEFGHI